ncbi:unnamed protein product [Urochloa humidicola]
MVMEYTSWWPLSSWISPGAALFLFCNALVGAIMVTSSRGEQGGRTVRRLCRSGSSMVLDRLRSFSIFSGHPTHVEDSYHLELEAEEEQQPQPAAEPAIPTAPASSATEASSESAEEMVEEGKDEPVSSEQQDQGPACHRLGHAHQQLPPSSAAAAEATTEATAVAEQPATVVGSIVQRARACRRELVEEALEGKAALNARAELFIRQFREDLKLQRLNSIINYTRSLRRGHGGASAAAEE